jgi:hypothetical protein
MFYAFSKDVLFFENVAKEVLILGPPMLALFGWIFEKLCFGSWGVLCSQVLIPSFNVCPCYWVLRTGLHFDLLLIGSRTV